MAGGAPDNFGVLRGEVKNDNTGTVEAFFFRAWRLCDDPLIKSRIADSICTAGGTVPSGD